MATDYWPFNAGLGADSFEDRWRKMAKWWLGDGPISADLDGMAVFADSAGMLVHVRAGRAWVSGEAYEESAQFDVPIAANSSGNPRIDRVVIQVDFAARTIAVVPIQGTPAGSPVPPALTKDTSVWQVALAQVNVANAAATIAAGAVTDERPLRAPTDVQSRAAASDQTVSSNANASTNLDSELYAWLEPNTRYEFECRIEYRAAGAADFRWNFLTPTGATGRHFAVGRDPSAGTLIELVDDLPTGLVVQGTGTALSDYHMVVVRGYVLNGSTAGRLSLRWAQGTSDASTTTRRAGSRLRVERAA